MAQFSDGWSRKILWLTVCKSNNFPEIPASFYLSCVKEQGGCPEIVGTDNGTENGIIAIMQCYFKDSWQVSGKSSSLE